MDSRTVYLTSFLIFVLSLSQLQLSESKGINVGICDDHRFTCQCGSPVGYKFQVPVKQCTYFYRWRTYCKPCDKVKEEEICGRYTGCKECEGDKDHCVTCPEGRSGTWCNNVDQCLPPESVPNIQWIGNSYKVGDIITAQCAINYTLMGGKSRTCTPVGAWTASVATCEKICRFPALGAHLQTKVNPSLVTKLMDADNKEIIKEIEFSCDAGYALIGPHRIVCDVNGEWDQQPPQCKPKIICADPGTLLNGTRGVTEDVDGMFAPGTQIKFSCNKNYFLDGMATITCTTTGKWSSTLPKCLKVTGCPSPKIPKNGKVEITKPVPEMRTLKVVSRVGLPPRVTSTSTVSPIIKLPSGYANVNSRALYSCESIYYRLRGPSSRLCQENGKWSGQEPACEAICGRAVEPKRPSIINGTVTQVGKWPWQTAVSVWDKKRGHFELSCGGSLLSEVLVITAAHCVVVKGTNRPLPLNETRIHLGKYFRYEDVPDPEVVKMNVESVIVHPNYHPRSLDSDLALIKLARPATFNARIQPVCLPVVNDRAWEADLAEGLNGTIVGWGIIDDGFPADFLFEAAIPIVNRTRCETEYRSVNVSVTLTTNMFCAGLQEGGIGTCSGDSGGPFMVKDESGPDDKWILEGISSWGGSTTCAAAHQYSGFLKIANFVDWIHQYL